MELCICGVNSYRITNSQGSYILSNRIDKLKAVGKYDACRIEY